MLSVADEDRRVGRHYLHQDGQVNGPRHRLDQNQPKAVEKKLAARDKHIHNSVLNILRNFGNYLRLNGFLNFTSNLRLSLNSHHLSHPYRPFHFQI